MNDNRDAVDKAFDAIAAWYEKFLSKGLAVKWFQWVEWVTLTAALWAIAEKSGSIIVRLFAMFSVLVVFFAAWFSTDKFASEILPQSNTLPRSVVAVLALLVALVPVIAMQFIAEVIQGILE